MKIKESRLRQIVKEAIYKEVGKKVINEGRVDEFLGGLFGFGKKKKKATDKNTPTTTQADIDSAAKDAELEKQRMTDKDTIKRRSGAELMFLAPESGQREYKRFGQTPGDLKGVYSTAKANMEYGGGYKSADEAIADKASGKIPYFYVPQNKSWSEDYYAQAVSFQKRPVTIEDTGMNIVDPAHLDWESGAGSSGKAMRDYLKKNYDVGQFYTNTPLWDMD